MFILNNDLMKECFILGFGNYIKYNIKVVKVLFLNYMIGCK